MRKKILEKKLARLQAKKTDLVARCQASADVNEVRSLTAQMEDVNAEIEETQAELDAIEASQTEEERKAAYDRAEDELGDFLFATVNAARLYGLNPDTALERTCAKFRRRFTYLEEQTIRKGRNLKDMTLAEMDAIWDEGKAKGL